MDQTLADALHAVAPRSVRIEDASDTKRRRSAGAWMLEVAQLLPAVSAVASLVRRKKQPSRVPQGVSFGAGLLVGAGAGVLLAPRSGAEVRELFRSYVAGTPLEEVTRQVAAPKPVSQRASSTPTARDWV